MKKKKQIGTIAIELFKPSGEKVDTNVFELEYPAIYSLVGSLIADVANNGQSFSVHVGSFKAMKPFLTALPMKKLKAVRQ
jgi:hypothetical protein